MTNDNGHGFLAGLLLGSTLGAMAALLAAPKSGRQLRQELIADGERLRDRAGDKALELKDRSEKAIQRTKATARQTAAGVKDAARVLRG